MVPEKTSELSKALGEPMSFTMLHRTLSSAMNMAIGSLLGPFCI